MWDDDDKPKRLSLRERMALKEKSSPPPVIPILKNLDNPIRKYRQSRQLEESVEIEVSTKRRVVRFTDDGEQEVSVRERNLKNVTKEDVQRDIVRKSQTFESLVEEEDEEEDVNNNNNNNNNNHKSKPVAAETRTTRKQETTKKDLNGNELTEDLLSTVTIETVVNGNKEVSEVEIHEQHTITSDGIDITTTEKIIRNTFSHEEDSTTAEQEPGIRKSNRLRRQENEMKVNDDEKRKSSDQEAEANKLQKNKNDKEKDSAAELAPKFKTKTAPSQDISKDETDPKPNNQTSPSSVTDRFANKNNDNNNSKNIRNRFERNDTRRQQSDSSNEKNSIRNKFEQKSETTNKRLASSVGDAKSRFDEKRKSPDQEVEANKLQKNKNDKEKDSAAELAPKFKTKTAPSQDISKDETDPKPNNQTSPSSVTDRFANKNNNNNNSKNIRNRFERNGTRGQQSDSSNEKNSIRNKFEQKSVGDAKSRFENKKTDNDNKISSINKNLDSPSRTVNGIKRESPKLVEEEIVVTEETFVVESANTAVAVTDTKTREKVGATRKDIKERFENKRNGASPASANKRPQSMVDFKSKFENQKTPSTTSKHPLPKTPIKMNIRSKFESDNDENKSDGNKTARGLGTKSKFEPQKTTPTAVVPTKRAQKTEEEPKKQVKSISETKVEVDSENSHLEVVTTEMEATQGEGKNKQEIKETKTMEIKDTGKTHSEKMTTVTNIKTQEGTMIVKKTETKFESTSELKKVARTTTSRDGSKPKALSVEERLKEQKKKQEAARKSQAANSAKGRNAFKLQLEANKPVTLTLGATKAPASNSNIDKLLSWIAKRVNKYPEVNVTNYTSSWENGIALCVLMHYFLGDEKINLAKVTHETRKGNFEMAISAATEAGVPALLDANELAACREMDRRSMITYLHTVYKVLFADKQEKK